MRAQTVSHPFAPVFDPSARVLILGTMPSAASRESGFYYGHPRNRFWPLMALLFGAPVPPDTEAKKAFLLRHGVALWDVLASCHIEGSSDAGIREPRAHDFRPLFSACPGLAVFANGQAAGRLYRALAYPETGVPATPLPSTSPANAAWSLERLAGVWAAVRDVSAV